jgi:glycosyltransferase EpsD
MSNKVLFCATVDYHFSAFHLPVLEWFKRMGWEVHVAARGKIDLPFVDKKYDLPVERSPLRWRNLDAYRQLKRLIDRNGYRIVHCHTPMGGVLARLAARDAREKGTKVIYTAHGFHFCKGAPLLNWLYYYPIENRLARQTDCLITINNEDYNLAVNRKFKAGRIAHVHGVGINTDRYRPVTAEQKLQLRLQSPYGPDDLLMFYAAEFNKNKNHRLILHAIAKIKDQVPSLKLLLAGTGPLQEECRKLAARLGIDRMVHFLGYRKDIDLLLPMCDAAVASSLREGLPVNVMEAMACGLPVIATHNRGHAELVADQKNGYLVAAGDVDLFAERIVRLCGSSGLRQQMGSASEKAIRKYDVNQVGKELHRVYSAYMTGESDDTQNQYRSAYL